LASSDCKHVVCERLAVDGKRSCPRANEIGVLERYSNGIDTRIKYTSAGDVLSVGKDTMIVRYVSLYTNIINISNRATRQSRATQFEVLIPHNRERAASQVGGRSPDSSAINTLIVAVVRGRAVAKRHKGGICKRCAIHRI